mgnify:CR=1 FL=1
MVMATPLLEVLKKGDPDIYLGFLAEKGHGQVLKGHPFLDHLHLLEFKGRGAGAQARAAAASDHLLRALSPMEMLSDLRGAGYDLAVDLFFNPRSAWLLGLSGIPKRISGTAGSRRFLYSHNVIPSLNPARFQELFYAAPGGMGEHLARLAPLFHVESGLDFVSWVLQQYPGKNLGPFLPRAYWASQVPQFVPGFEKYISDHPIILAPGATWNSKEWPFCHWEKLIEDLLKQSSKPILVIQPPGSGTSWGDLGLKIPSSRGGVLPVLNLETVFGLLSQAAMLVSVDGGVMHTGVGLGVPTIGLFGPTDPNLWFPYANAGPFRVMTSRAHCAPCNLHQCDKFICLPDLKPDRVLARCLEMLSDGAANSLNKWE